jgi:hypothetical protein
LRTAEENNAASYTPIPLYIYIEQQWVGRG